jgi:hypothetical protein
MRSPKEVWEPLIKSFVRKVGFDELQEKYYTNWKMMLQSIGLAGGTSGILQRLQCIPISFVTPNCTFSERTLYRRQGKPHRPRRNAGGSGRVARA